MGGASVVVLAAGFVRAKAIALIFGASGVGLIGLFNAFSGNVASFAGWGLGTSGVRLIAGAPEEGKPTKIAAVRRMGWALSGLGLALALLTFWPVGVVTFDSNHYAVEMAMVALAVPCMIAASTWSAILQASGKIGSLARIQIAGALIGLLLGLPSIYFWGTIGIALSIFFAAAVPAALLWRAARAKCPSSHDVAVERDDLRQLAKLGGALMVVGWLGQLSAYLVRLAIIRQEGLDAAGYYQAAFAISGSLPGFVFAAMGTDFFPRVAAAKDEADAQMLCEKQIQAGLLLALPPIAALLTLGQVCIHLLYARGFDAAIPLLSWMVWGVFLRLLAWPLGYCLLARGSARAVIVVESAAVVLLVLLTLVLVPALGAVGAAMAFFASYVVYAVVMLAVSHRRSGRWLSATTLGWFAAAAAVLGFSQWVVSLLGSPYWGLIPTALLSVLCAWIYIHTIRREKIAR